MVSMGKGSTAQVRVVPTTRGRVVSGQEKTPVLGWGRTRRFPGVRILIRETEDVGVEEREVT